MENTENKVEKAECKCGGNCKCKKQDNNAFADYMKDLTEKDQPTCSLEDQEGCENCGS
tara:strand:- start:18219 stop:18392 length:174 start_codon:yes stop_codon:yes gene_type:complete